MASAAIHPPVSPTPQHHLYDELLLDYAAGACGEAESLLIATHLALCPCCRERVMQFEEVGGALLDAIEPAEMAEDCLDAVLAEIDQEERAAAAAPAPPSAGTPGRCEAGHMAMLPEPLRSYLGADAEKLCWQPVMRGLDEIDIPVSSGCARAKLLRIRAGAAVPQHTHEGNELTLVLAGAFNDGCVHFARGDVSISDAEVDHRPVADPGEDCLCLTVIDAKLKLTGPIGRFLNPFVKF